MAKPGALRCLCLWLLSCALAFVCATWYSSAAACPHCPLLACLPPAGTRRSAPEEAFVAIETLLPTGACRGKRWWAPCAEMQGQAPCVGCSKD